MRHDHSSTAIPREAKSVHGISAREIQRCWSAEDPSPNSFSLSLSLHPSHPSEYSACKRSKYVSHLLPITLPQVKHRTGMIIITDSQPAQNHSTVVCKMALKSKEAVVHLHFHSRHYIAAGPTSMRRVLPRVSNGVNTLPNAGKA